MGAYPPQPRQKKTVPNTLVLIRKKVQGAFHAPAAAARKETPARHQRLITGQVRLTA